MKKKIIAIVLSVVMIVCGITYVFAADAGSDGDPLVTKSYVDSVKNDLYSYIAASSNTYELVTVQSGKSIYLGASTEAILRMGSAQIIGSSQGGICDVTGGCDLANGMAVPANHMLLVPRDDGRGVSVTGSGDAIFMIRGSYTIK